MKLFKYNGGNTFSLITESNITNIENQLQPLNIKYFAVYDFDDDNIPRPILSIPINNKLIAFYRSSKGTTGKTQGQWYAVFGIGSGDWLIKGHGKDIDSGYGVPAIKNIMDSLNTIFPPDMDVNTIISILSNLYGKPIFTRSLMFKTYGNALGRQPNLDNTDPSKVYKHINNIISSL